MHVNNSKIWFENSEGSVPASGCRILLSAPGQRERTKGQQSAHHHISRHLPSTSEHSSVELKHKSLQSFS
ncbi:hypothetical protein K432DRAFT_381251 [Lepidopterella palustris CBS 459.81]|uniref:Uncharacterized protein n=1 Tax=Lepidopterella palustris CBS 459.81 TaxID=1314670 RepID=A0A8E2ECX4_9PEZI|nr:hypothetical protein K432DRAFT_381251 [Lepidopterella palustris CBS 459.81]